MPIKVVCACGMEYQVREEFARRQVKCQKCPRVLTIPSGKTTTDIMSSPTLGRQEPLPPAAMAEDLTGPDVAPQSRAVFWLLVVGGAGLLTVVLLVASVVAFLFLFSRDPVASTAQSDEPTVVDSSQRRPEEGGRRDKDGAKSTGRGEKEPPPPSPVPPPSVWKGHTGVIYSVAFSSDGRALSGSGDVENRLAPDNSVRLWDVGTGTELKALKDFKDGISCVAFSPDGRLAILGSAGQWRGNVYVRGRDFTVQLWDVQTGTELTFKEGLASPGSIAPEGVPRFKGHEDELLAVAFSPDSLRALTCSMDRTMRLWDVKTGRQLHCFRGHPNTVFSVAFSPDGRLGLSCSGEKAWLWDLDTGRQLRVFEGHTDHVHKACFSPDGRYVLTCSGGQPDPSSVSNGVIAIRGGKDHTVRLWDLDTGQEVRRFQGHTKVVSSAVFSRSGRQIISGSVDGTVRLWDVASGKELRRFPGHQNGVSSVAVSPDGRYVLSGGGDSCLRLWELPVSARDLAKVLQAGDVQALARAVKDIDAMGPDARSTLPAFLDALRGPAEIRDLSLVALKQIGPPDQEHVAVLRTLLKDKAPEVRLYAFETLGAMGPAARNAIPDLIQAFQSPDEDTRKRAEATLRKIGPLTREHIPLLLPLLKHKTPEVHQYAFQALGNMREAAQSAAPALSEALKDADVSVRRNAAQTLGKVGPAAKEMALRGLFQALKDEDGGVRTAADEALGKMGPPAADDIRDLLRELKDRNGRPEARRHAVRALGELGPGAGDDGLAAIAEALKDVDFIVRCRAADALEKIGPKSGQTAERLTEALQQYQSPENAEFRLRLVRALARTEPKAALPGLLQALADRDNEVSKVAEKELNQRTDSFTKSDVAGFRESLRKSKAPKFLHFACRVLAALKQDAGSAVPELGEVLRADGKNEETLRFSRVPRHSFRPL